MCCNFFSLSVVLCEDPQQRAHERVHSRFCGERIIMVILLYEFTLELTTHSVYIYLQTRTQQACVRVEKRGELLFDPFVVSIWELVSSLLPRRIGANGSEFVFLLFARRAAAADLLRYNRHRQFFCCFLLKLVFLFCAQECSRFSCQYTCQRFS